MRSAALVCASAVGLGACRGGTVTAPRAADGPCDLIQAMLAIDSPAYQKMYEGASCGGPMHRPLIVQVDAAEDLFPKATTCPGRSFEIFHGDPDVQGMIVQLLFIPDGAQWNVMASLDQPNPTPTADGGFDSAETYCHAVTGFVERRDGGWRTFVDVDRALPPNAP
jgi:hypothetical protein